MHYLNNSFFMQIFLFLMYIIFEFLNMKKRFFRSGTVLYAIFDEYMHILYYTIIVFPLINNYVFYFSGLIACGLIDIDHFIMARSLKIENAVSLNHRPFTHSFLFSLILSFVVFLVFRNWSVSVGILSGLLLHIFRDMLDSKTLIFYPARYFSNIKFSYFLIISVLFIIIIYITNL